MKSLASHMETSVRAVSAVASEQANASVGSVPNRYMFSDQCDIFSPLFLTERPPRKDVHCRLVDEG